VRVVAFAAALFVLHRDRSPPGMLIAAGKRRSSRSGACATSASAVKALIRSAPPAFFVGTPLYNAYLRLLGARIGPNTVLRCRLLPVCTDLLSIGSGTILRSECLLLGYKAQANHIYTGPIRIGDDAIVGESSVVDIDTEMEDGAQLAHSSSLQSGQRIPRDKRYHGSPAQETTADYRFVAAKTCTPLRRMLFSAFQLGGVLLVLSWIPVLLYYAVPALLHASDGAQFASTEPGPDLLVLAAEILAVSFALFFAALLLGLVIVGVVPRLLHPLLRKDETYVLYGFHYWVVRAIAVLSNSPAYNLIFGDSALVVQYLRFVGYRLNTIVQTGSNFGLVQKHDDPFLCDIGSGTMVSDNLKMINAPMTSSSFALRSVRIGERNYLGNNINFPAAAKVGANCLLATKVLVPVDGPMRENVGLLGSPCFEIPRVVDRDQRLKVVDDDLRAN
jgi:non-ribosomal peptide synthetase-like protein